MRGPISIIVPEETPFASMVKKGPAPHNTFTEFLADTLRKPRTAGSREGSSGAKGGNKATKRQRFGVYQHRFHDTFGVTDIQQLITVRGGTVDVPSEYDYAEAKCIREIKRDIEAVFCSANDTNGGNDDEMKTRGAFKWLEATQTPQVPADFVTPAAQRVTGLATLTEAAVNGVLKSLKSNYGGAREYQCIAGNDYIEDFDNFTRVNSDATNIRYRVNENAATHEITLMVKVFRSTFGSINIIPSEFVNVDANGDGDVDSLLILNMDLWEALWMEALNSNEDPPDAGGQSGYCKAVGALGCHNPKGNASIKN